MFYANEHPPAHFHARIAEFQAIVDIDSIAIVAGRLPPAQMRSVLTWAASRQDLLRRTFVAAMAHEKVGPIE
ncbi:DUF4160 domain-containing protein [Bradyrhizobium sp.]|uniref:DUF4160 domain-containing protein n=1 Tax=Bradyrhizobium sp. TaxID=376 RepID=UPI0025BB0452|nr:DUF4160 domain-containing protein [Bradyrhizobium sp.]